jgi:hypothetical protein
MSKIASRIVALEKKAPHDLVPHEDRLARFRSKGRGSLSAPRRILSAEDRERLIAKVKALRGRAPNA